MRFEWDENKNEANQKKHGIPFEVAVRVFEDENRVMFIESIKDGEERWHAIGFARGDEPGTLWFLTVVHTYTEEGMELVVRLISARRATRQEKRLYDEAIL